MFNITDKIKTANSGYADYFSRPNINPCVRNLHLICTFHLLIRMSLIQKVPEPSYKKYGSFKFNWGKLPKCTVCSLWCIENCSKQTLLNIDKAKITKVKYIFAGPRTLYYSFKISLPSRHLINCIWCKRSKNQVEPDWTLHQRHTMFEILVFTMTNFSKKCESHPILKWN